MLKPLAKILTLTCLLALSLPSAGGAVEPLDPSAVDRLVADSGGSAYISLQRTTGAASFLRLEPGSLSLDLPAEATLEERAAAFFDQYGSIFGIRSPESELRLTENRVDRLGSHRLSYVQHHRGVEVFGGWLRVHFDSAGELKVVNGNFVPGLDLDPTPRFDADAAADVALDLVAGADLSVASSELRVFRSGMVRGIEGRDHLVWEIEVGNGFDVREFVYVDAHTRKLVDRINGIHEAIHRTIHEFNFGNVLWNEGDPYPYVGAPPDPVDDPQINDLIDFAEDTYDLFASISGGTFLSWDGVDGIMHSVYDHSGINCPNATWNGQSTNYCNGVTGDDTVAHEWAHGYTDSTHNLIYQWQPGALNESYSDVFGEVVDFINGAGTDSPDPVRGPDGCSVFGGSPAPTCTINSPMEVAGDYPAAGAAFNPPAPITVTADLEYVDDGAGASDNDGCEPLVGFTPGNIALIDRGTCNFTIKVVNAQNAGAVGVKVVNDRPGLLVMGGADPTITIPSVILFQSDGDDLKAALQNGAVNGTIELEASTQNSLRWLSGEDDPAFGGAIRDMWNPNCYGDPGKVSDTAQYVCTEDDNGGVHTNSGIPNHEFSLLVDGGTYNGVTVTALGLTKATHLFWHAMITYQGPTSNFFDHADSMEQSCFDLLGVNLLDLTTGAPSGEMLSMADCFEVTDALEAVEMRDPPDFCGFEPLLDPNTPFFECDSVFSDDFESDPSGTWTLTNDGVFDEYMPRDWEWTADVPPNSTGMAFFAIDSVDIGDCVPGSDDQSGVMHLDSPPIVLPAGATTPALVFDHWVATEELWDGGNVKIRVNGLAYQVIAASDYYFNPLNGVLNTAAAGNTNPMEGEEAFTGTDGGSLQGSWGQSQIDLSSYAGPGDTVEIRFDLGVDGCNGSVGWYVDNVDLCATSQTDMVFSDNFEAGDASEWSRTVP